MESQCPYCGRKPRDKPLKEWSYRGVKVNRYQCQCGKKFNHYQSKNSTWTIPKPK